MGGAVEIPGSPLEGFFVVLVVPLMLRATAVAVAALSEVPPVDSFVVGDEPTCAIFKCFLNI
jgi:hypothetical protein